MRDLYGDEARQWNAVEARFRAGLSAFGYGEIRTPVLEKIEVFSQTVGDETDIVEKQMYVVQAGDETLVLRPEGTAAFMRAVIEHNLHRTAQAQRYFYYLSMFRHERPQKGRLRQFHQMGAEIIHDPSPEADAELMVLLHSLLQSVGITEFQARLNSVGDTECRPPYKEKLKDFFRPRLTELCELCQKRFERSPLRILDCKSEVCRSIAAGAPLILNHLCAGCRTHHEGVKKALGMAGIRFEEDPHIVRGLDYYCRTAFEFTSDLLGAQSALGGGGRYDGLSTRFGEAAFPSTGFALGMERILLILEQKKSLVVPAPQPVAYLAPLGDEAFKQLFPLCFSLKRKGVWVEMSYDRGKGLKALMKNADRLGARYTVILGEDELAKSQVAIKKMDTGDQEILDLNRLEQELIRRSTLAS
jgi:histidyl-tRNA synthetase